MMRARCTSIVRGLIPSCRPASLLEAPPHDLGEHVLLARGQRLAAGEVEGLSLGSLLALLASIGCDRFAHARHHLVAAKRLLDEIERAVPDGINRHRDVALAGHHEGRHRVVAGVEFLEDIEPRLARNVDIKDDACGTACARRRQHRGAVSETHDLVAFLGKHDRQGLADRRIVVDNKNLRWTGGRLRHRRPSVWASFRQRS